MNAGFVGFDDIWPRVVDALAATGPLPESALPAYLVRDLYGHITITVSEALEDDCAVSPVLMDLAERLEKTLGLRARPAGQAVLYVSDRLLNILADTALEIEGFPQIYRAERLMTAAGWWTVREPGPAPHPFRCTLFSVKGGVGRSTTLAFLARYLAREGLRVLAVDLDLESPGLGTTVLEPERRARFGVTDWFAEDLVGQGNHILADMLSVPAWAQDCDGAVSVVAAHGADPGEYLAKLGRAYVTPRDAPWSQRLAHLLEQLEHTVQPTVTLIESRSGLHDIAAACVTDLNAEVLLFSTGAESAWLDYDMLFRHWNTHKLSRSIRDRLTMVAALTPQEDRHTHLRDFRVRAWDLFRNHLYDAVDGRDTGIAGSCAGLESDDAFSFDVNDSNAPHTPLEVDWTRGLMGGTPLVHVDDPVMHSAYGRFAKPFVERILSRRMDQSA